MYRITEEIRKFLVENSREIVTPGIQANSTYPYVVQDSKAIGVGDAFRALGLDCDYFIFEDYPMEAVETLPAYCPAVAGIWLLKKGELKNPVEPVTMPRYLIDGNCEDKEELIDISECCASHPSPIERLTCNLVTSLKRLIELEPDLKKCLTQYSVKGFKR